MKTLLSILFALLFGFSAISQDQVKCYSTEIELELQEKYPERANDDQFEEWMSKQLEKAAEKSERGVVVLPIVFHIMHGGEPVGSGTNIPSSFINAQLQQLNDDFRRAPGTAGFNTNPVGADLEIEFCMATIDPDGNVLAEPGIDRVDAPSLGLNAPGYNTNYMDDVVKPNTIWDPEQYVNVWVTPINLFFFSVLGYAQFPSATGLPGLNANEGPASSDGVVVSPETIGSVSLPNPAGGVVGAGRTLTHELGHFFGLRHIWGDGGCNADDFCADTPQSDGSNYGCQTGSVSCNSVDMVENYMDYSDDLCMNIFTQDQKARVDVVLANSPRRTELLNSTVCEPGTIPCQSPYPAVSNLNATNTAEGVLLTWDPIVGSIGCRIRAGLASVGFQQTVTVFQSEASEFFVSEGLIQNGQDYQWQVQCGCSTSPLVVGPWSETAFFNFGQGIGFTSGDSRKFREVSLFPNPASDEVMISAQGAQIIRIVDLQGRMVDDRIANKDGRFPIDLTGFAPGAYLVNITYPDGYRLTERLIVE